ncbi:hypothetical protein ACWGRF_23980 [Streptomyces zhihengii]
MQTRFRFRSPIGGLAADLSAELRPVASRPPAGIVVGRGVWLVPPEGGAHWQDLAWLCLGVGPCGRELTEARPGGVAVVVDSLAYPLADYLPEVAALVMEEFLLTELGREGRAGRVTYCSRHRAYAFDWGTERPFSEL